DWRRLASRLAMPVAGLVLLLAYLQAATGFLPLGSAPLSRLLGVGMKRVASELGAQERQTGARLVLASDYETTAWLRFYAPGLSLVAVDQPGRYMEAPLQEVQGPALYVSDRSPDARLLKNFKTARRLADLVREREGRPIGRFSVWFVAMPQSRIQGRRP
ncbi:MAG: hypothetical protein ACREFW_03150, partial [Rhizomicrobium sp.]